MNLTGFYPVLCTQNIPETVDYYATYFDFQETFEAEWYVSLRMRARPEYELAVIDSVHESMPECARKSIQGLILNFEVGDVDLEYARIRDAGLPVLKEIKSEDWGQRHFITRDPNGVLIDVIQMIEPSQAFSEQNANGVEGT